MSKITVQWELEGQGVLEIPRELVTEDGMSDEEIEEWIDEGVRLEVHEQGSYHIRIRGLPEALEKLRV
jgi:hypothetical protein